MHPGWGLDHETHLCRNHNPREIITNCARTIGRADGRHNLPCAGGGAKDKLRPLRAEGKKGGKELPFTLASQVGEK